MSCSKVVYAKNPHHSNVPIILYCTDAPLLSCAVLNILKRSIPNAIVMGLQEFKNFGRLLHIKSKRKAVLVLHLPEDMIHIFDAKTGKNANPFIVLQKLSDNSLSEDVIVSGLGIQNRFCYSLDGFYVSMMAEILLKDFCGLINLELVHAVYCEDLIRTRIQEIKKKGKYGLLNYIEGGNNEGKRK